MADTLRDTLNDVVAALESERQLEGMTTLQALLWLLDKAAADGLEIMVDPELESLYVSISVTLPEWLRPSHRLYRPGYE